jgi:hypothetical protein
MLDQIREQNGMQPQQGQVVQGQVQQQGPMSDAQKFTMAGQAAASGAVQAPPATGQQTPGANRPGNAPDRGPSRG